MREPKRLFSEGATDFERQLLKAVMNERPSSMMRSRMQQGLGIAGPITWAGNAKALLTSLGTKSGITAAFGGVVAAGGLAAAVGLGPFASEPAQAPVAMAASPVAMHAPAANEAPSAPPVGSEAGLEVAELERSSQLREEIAVLDTARVALQQGASARALTVLARYEEQFPSGILSREANLLERQAATKSSAASRQSRARRSSVARGGH